MKLFRTFTICSSFIPDCRYDKSIILFLGTCYVQTQCVLRNFRCTERLFNILKKVYISVLNASPRVKCARFLLNNKQIRSSWSLARGFFWRDSKSIQDVNGDFYCPGKFCSWQSVSIYPYKEWKKIDESLYKYLQSKAYCQVRTFFLGIKTKNHVVGRCSYIMFCQEMSRDYKNETPSPFQWVFSTNHTQPRPSLYQRNRNYSFYGIILSPLQ